MNTSSDTSSDVTVAADRSDAVVVYRIDEPGTHPRYSHRPLGKLLGKGARPVAIVTAQSTTLSGEDTMASDAAQTALLRAGIAAGRDLLDTLITACAPLDDTFAALADAVRTQTGPGADTELLLDALETHLASQSRLDAFVLKHGAEAAGLPLAELLANLPGGTSGLYSRRGLCPAHEQYRTLVAGLTTSTGAPVDVVDTTTTIAPQDNRRRHP